MDFTLSSSVSTSAAAGAAGGIQQLGGSGLLKQRHVSSSGAGSYKKGTREFRLEDGDLINFDSIWAVLPYYIIYIFSASWILGLYVGNTWLAFWIGFAFLPLADLLFPMDHSNPNEEDAIAHENDLRFKIPVLLWVPMQALAAFGCAYLLGTPVELLPECFSYLSSGSQRVGLLLGTAIMTGGVGITVAHELLHKISSPLEVWCGHFLLALVNYGHFALEHVAGHHKAVATPEDPASAPAGVTVYSFYLRSLTGSWWSAWKYEQSRIRSALRLHRLQRPASTLGSAVSDFFFGLYSNRMIGFAIAPMVIGALIAWTWGWWATFFFYLQGWIGHVLLEIINYVEHYGLRRREISPGKYEPVDMTHSWNAPHSLSNFFLFKLQRHSDHHAHSLRRYHLLRTFRESPQLPSGYPGMLLLALLPPLWFRVMDPMVQHYNSSDDKATTASLTKQRTSLVTGFTLFVFTIITWLTFFWF